MAGLLDNYLLPPEVQREGNIRGLLGMLNAFGKASGPSPVPVGFGAIAGTAADAGLQAMDRYEQGQTQRSLLGAQIGDLRRKAQEREQAVQFIKSLPPEQQQRATAGLLGIPINDTLGALPSWEYERGADGSIRLKAGVGEAKGRMAGLEDFFKTSLATPAYLQRRQGEKEQDFAMDPAREAALSNARLPSQMSLAGFSADANAAAGARYAEPTAYGRSLGEGRAAIAPVPNPYDPAGGTAPLAQIKSQAATTGTQIGQPPKLPETETKLRAEFEGDASVKTYRTVVPTYNAMVDAAKRDNKASDLNIVYGLAKLMDPTSVVRESEFAMAAQAGNFGERIQGLVNMISGGGRLVPELRAQLLDEAKSRVDAYKATHDQVANQYRSLAKQYLVKPENVINEVKVSQPPARITPDAVGKAAYDALPKGAAYTDPTGELRIKK